MVLGRYTLVLGTGTLKNLTTKTGNPMCTRRWPYCPYTAVGFSYRLKERGSDQSIGAFKGRCTADVPRNV